jgi:hypothetical protein
VHVWNVVAVARFITAIALHVWQACAPAGVLVAIVIHRGAWLTHARLAAKYIISQKSVIACCASFTCARLNRELAQALTAVLVTNVELIERSVSIAQTRRAAILRIRA